MAFSLHGYHDTNLRLPPLVDVGEGSPTGRGLTSVFWMLIPYMESTHLQFRLREGSPEAYHGHSSTVFRFRWKADKESDPMAVQRGGDANHSRWLFVCPSDATADKLRDVPVTLPDGSTGYYATGSYAANGLLPWNAGKFSLGSAETILFGERQQVCRTAAGETLHNLWGVGFYSPQMPTFATLAPGPETTGQIAPVVPLDADQLRVRVGLSTAAPQPVDFVSPFQRTGSGRPCDPRLPGSPHPEGMQAAMADGSVRTFAPDVTSWVFWAACVPSPAPVPEIP